MASSKTTTRTVRITNEAADYFEKKPLNRFIESLYGLLTSGKIKIDGEELRVECTHQNSEKIVSVTPENKKSVHTDISDIEEMASLMRVPTETLLSDFRKLLEDGELYYSGNRLVNPHYEEFEQLCELKKQPIDKVIGNVIRQMGG